MKQILQQLEAGLDPAHPGGVTVLAYGEISAALVVPGLEHKVAKRMSGFADHAMANAYCDLVEDYIATLRAEGISVVDTDVVRVDRPPRPPVVYLVQPLVADLGHHMLRSASDAELTEAVQMVLDRVWTLHQCTDSQEVAIDAQLSNWSFTDHRDPVLLDVGTPFMRRNGKHLFDVEIVLSAMPPGIRSYYRRGVAAAYMDDYFVPRLVVIDLLGNFIKEHATQRLPEGIVAVNDWLDTHNLELIQRSEVEEYYKKDAAALELFLRVRRMDRTVRHLFRRDYDFILPGRVARR
ncbi:MAG: DUF6206 family protein [Dermatophilaceae bacterium]